MRCASSRLTSSRAFTSISRKVALGWDAFHAFISRRISSLSSLKLFSSFIFPSAWSFLPSFPSRKMKLSPIFPVFRRLGGCLPPPHEAFPILPRFPLSGDLPRAKKWRAPARIGEAPHAGAMMQVNKIIGVSVCRGAIHCAHVLGQFMASRAQ